MQNWQVLKTKKKDKYTKMEKTLTSWKLWDYGQQLTLSKSRYVSDNLGAKELDFLDFEHVLSWGMIVLISASLKVPDHQRMLSLILYLFLKYRHWAFEDFVHFESHIFY